MKEITVKALVDNLGVVTDFVDDILDGCDCPMKVKLQIDIAIDEIFSNICHYAYGDSKDSEDSIGDATIRVEIEDATKSDAEDGALNDRKAVRITFIDEGTPYNPLEREDPDTTLSAEERLIGGLGIYMVKKSMDEMKYEYSDGRNVLSMKKNM